MKKTALSAFIVGSFIIYSLLEAGSKNSSPSSVKLNPKPNTAAQPAASYQDGQYTGIAADAFYGNIQIVVDINGGRIADISFLQYPNDSSHSREINARAMPILKQEAIQAQSAMVDVITGATDTSQAFIKSLTSALNQAQ